MAPMLIEILTEMNSTTREVSVHDPGTVQDLRKKVAEAWGISGFAMAISTGPLDDDAELLSETGLEGGEVVMVTICPKKAAELQLAELNITKRADLRLLEFVRKGAAERCDDGSMQDETLFLKMELCIQAGFPVEDRLLIIAANNGHKDTVRYLAQRGADVNAAVGPRHETALLSAARQGLAGMCEVLLEMGARPDAIDPVGKSALHLAAQAGHTVCVELLLHSGVDINLKDTRGFTPLMLACNQGYTAAALALIKGGADVSCATPDDTALKMAALHSSANTVAALLEAGSSANFTDSSGKTILWYTAARGDAGVLRLLIQHGADVNKADLNGHTPLLAAGGNGHEEAARVLLEGGADKSFQNVDGHTAFSLATIAGYDKLAALLK
eukprot:TRINITY_DN13630_c0_g1_i1.p2 TRINITY_DN13630_c0_g1~~TRINITY_DN13630_c0_g1_i1.p2  ORF type:complete len:408 (+),score=159.76 TRINITY_DN13630_c0_g1_i1:67-1224(+)